MRVSDTGGEVTQVTKLDSAQLGHGGPQWLPDGRHFLFQAGGSPNQSGVFLGNLKGTAPVRLWLPAPASAICNPAGSSSSGMDLWSPNAWTRTKPGSWENPSRWLPTLPMQDPCMDAFPLRKMA